MSPEQIKGKRVDARADVYAIGLILYEMLAGHHPLSGEGGNAGLPDELDRMAVLQLQMVPEPLSVAAPDVPLYVSAIVEKAMKKDREQRQRDMAELVRELRAARKRFMAEQQMAEATGAPDPGHRVSWVTAEQEAATAVRNPATGPSGTVKCAMPEMTADPADGEMATLLQTRPPERTGLTPVPAQEATEEVSQAGLLRAALGEAPTERAIVTGDVHARTTHTSPALGATSSRITPDAAIRDGSFAPAMFSRPALGRVWATLGLGALIGVPPAVVGVMWILHRPAPPRAAAPQSLAARVVSVETATARVTADPAPADVPPAASTPEPVAPPPAAPQKSEEAAVSAAPKRGPAKAAKLDAPDWGALGVPAAGAKKTAKKALPGSGL
jgi:hypothetical protein